MKKATLVSILLVLTSLVFLASCATGGNENPARGMDLPDWFINPPTPEDQYVGLGLAKMSDVSMSRTTAQARARTDIAYQVSASVQSMLTDYAQEAGVDGNSQVISFVETVSKQVADIELQGAVNKENHLGDDGTWYAMVWFPKAALIESVADVFQRNEDAAFAEFKASQALDRLNAELENNPPRSAGMESPVNQ